MHFPGSIVITLIDTVIKFYRMYIFIKFKVNYFIAANRT